MLKQQIYSDLINAKKARDQFKSVTLAFVMASIKQVEVDTRKELTDDEVVKILQKEVKKREEALVFYRQGNRQDLIDKESAELEFIKTYLPKMMTETEIGKIIDEVLKSAGDNPQFGQVMKTVMTKIAGKAEGKVVSELLKQKLS
ncbi:GatB/YqeY domain-containing protein [Candidatus Beckwithbacteria bacterium]|nr:GatB/YqeY domain-containing protein [Candidatus Beckwithbacteria bacterium]